MANIMRVISLKNYCEDTRQAKKRQNILFSINYDMKCILQSNHPTDDVPQQRLSFEYSWLGLEKR
jgi:hypothetical protein